MSIGLHHRSRWKVVLVVTMCFCGFLWTFILSIGITCCVVARAPYLRDSDISQEIQYVYPHGGKNHVRHEYKFQRENNENVLGKKLLQDSSTEYEYENEALQNLKSQDKHPPNDDVNSLTSSANIDKSSVKFSDISINSQTPTRDNTPVKVDYLSKDRNHERTSEQKPSYKRMENTALSEGTKRLPQAIIIGVKKGGTRALLEFLRIHPDVRAPGPETHFFDKNYHKGFEWYREQMPPTTDDQLTVEKTPSYLITKEVPRRIYSMSKDTKLVVVVRDPVTRAISDYTQAASKRPGMKPFIQMAFLGNYTGLVNTSWGAIRIGVYAKHVDRWLKYFPLRQIHFVNGEQLITNPAGVMANVQDFLGLRRVINEKHFHFNETKGFPCLKKEASSRPHCLGKSKGRHHPTVSAQVIERLRDFFRPFNAKLYHMVGQDFGWP